MKEIYVMKNIHKKTFGTLIRKIFGKKTVDRYHQYDLGFHGDKYLLEIVNWLVEQVDCFIETGTNVGSTLRYMAATYPQLNCLSCEPDMDAYQKASRFVRDLGNVTLVNETSQQFLSRLEEESNYLFDKNVLFWLDAHGYGFEWPLKDEIEFITKRFKKPLILIDDFKVPNQDVFGYDNYDNQICSFEYIQDSLASNHRYDIYYPAYSDKTSQHHPLRGWGLIAYGQEKPIEVPKFLANKIQPAIQYTR